MEETEGNTLGLGASRGEEMTQKLYRDSKGKFVSRKEKVEKLKRRLRGLQTYAAILLEFPSSHYKVRWKGCEYRRFRNKHKIYETF